MVQVATIQFNPALGQIERNLTRIDATVRAAARQGAELAVLPECAVTGYVYGSLAEAYQVAEPVPGPISNRLAALAARSGIYVVVGLLERVGDAVYNTALLLGPEGIVGRYRKTHVLCLGVDRFTTPGDTPYTVYQLPFARVGMLICYDLRFPEPARSLALQGAQLIALPTNWPRSSAFHPDVFTRARAAENRIFLLAADRCGQERGATFLGRSQIVDPEGTVLAEAPEEGDATLLHAIDPARADVKHVVLAPGEHEMDIWKDRRPELYHAIPGLPHPGYEKSAAR